MSIWTPQNCRKYPLEGLLGCVLSSGKEENPRNWRVGCCWGQSLYMRHLICPLFRVCVNIRGFESVKSNIHPGTFPLLFMCLSFLLYVFVVISKSRGTNYLRHDLAEGDFVDVRTLILQHSRDFMSVTASSVVFCFVFISAPLKHTRAMAATGDVGLCCCCCHSGR